MYRGLYIYFILKYITTLIVYPCKAETQTEQNLNFLEPEKSVQQTNQIPAVPTSTAEQEKEVDIPIVIVVNFDLMSKMHFQYFKILIIFPKYCLVFTASLSKKSCAN